MAPYYVPFPRSYYAKATHNVLCTYVSVCMCVRIPLCGGKAHILPVTLLRRAHRLAGTRPIDVRIVSLQGVPAEIYRILGNPVDK